MQHGTAPANANYQLKKAITETSAFPAAVHTEILGGTA